jgi:hypothetical protein
MQQQISLTAAAAAAGAVVSAPLLQGVCQQSRAGCSGGGVHVCHHGRCGTACWLSVVLCTECMVACQWPHCQPQLGVATCPLQYKKVTLLASCNTCWCTASLQLHIVTVVCVYCLNLWSSGQHPYWHSLFSSITPGQKGNWRCIRTIVT